MGRNTHSLSSAPVHVQYIGYSIWDIALDLDGVLYVKTVQSNGCTAFYNHSWWAVFRDGNDIHVCLNLASELPNEPWSLSTHVYVYMYIVCWAQIHMHYTCTIHEKKHICSYDTCIYMYIP